MKTFFILFALVMTNTAFARGQSRAYSIYDTPFSCDNGRTYQWHGRVMYVDGLAALNKVSYEIDCAGDGSGCSLYESGFHTANCQTDESTTSSAGPKEVGQLRESLRWTKRMPLGITADSIAEFAAAGADENCGGRPLRLD